MFIFCEIIFVVLYVWFLVLVVIVLCGEVLFECVLVEGLLILCDGESGELEVMLLFLCYYY